MAQGNLDLSRGAETNPGHACGDDDNACAIKGLRRQPPSAMTLTRPAGPAWVQKTTFLNARRHVLKAIFRRRGDRRVCFSN